ncbi:hypothetical protein LCGC14_0512220 [marine sediment metagenome]|uniref:Uncharacterized protein n=1 Tax=marine sediment metagenome TaxID=412755 RepID=A0A0F9S0Z2_9ZZZZ
MKTLIYSLSAGRLTHLSLALETIGLNARYDEEIDLSSVYFNWIQGLFVNDIDLQIQNIIDEFSTIISPYIEGNGFYCNTSYYLSLFWPVIEALDIPNRCVFLSHHPKRLVELYLLYGRMGITGIHKYGDELFPPSLDELYCVFPQDSHYQLPSSLEKLCDDEKATYSGMFHHWCKYWVQINDFFIQSNKHHFRSEEFNSNAQEVLTILYPEASTEQIELFKYMLHQSNKGQMKSLAFMDNWRGKEIDTYRYVCHHMCKQIGYIL